MKQQAPKTLPQKAETIENTRKTADILIGAACHTKTPLQSELLGVGHSGVFLIFSVISMFSRLA